jgi:gamma-glutamyltranspeptidase/glutathione hydrolase
MRGTAAAILVLASGALAAQEPTRSAPRIETMRPEIVGNHGIVAAGRNYTVEAGIRMLRAGGNAVDAGVAAVFAASVVEISHFGFGGEVPTLIYDAASRKVVVVNGQGTAPRAASPALFAAKGTIDPNGPLAATVPAVLDTMAIALSGYGTMRLDEVLGPAIELADGFVMYSFLHDLMARERAATERWEWSKRTYYPDGRVPETGEVFRQPNLARTLRAIAEADRAAFQKTRDRRAAIAAGRDAFYKGDIARRIAQADREAGGVLAYEDLAGYRGKVEEPVSTRFRGYDVFKAGPWNQGPVLLQTLNLLEGFDLSAMGRDSPDYVHTVHEAIKLAYADRNAFYGDPDFVKVPIRGLLSMDYAAGRRALIGPRASLEHRPGDPFAFDPGVPAPAARYVPHAQPAAAARRESGDTTAVDVVDAKGNLFSATPSSGWMLGGAFLAGDTGVPLSNRMQVFDLDPASPNVLAGGKRPRTTLTPTIVLKDGKPFLAISTPGGDSQDQQIANVLLNLLAFGLGLQESIEAPRFNSLHPFSSFEDHRSQPGVLEIESRFPPATLDELRRRGHDLRVLGSYGMATGVVAAGVDPRTGTLRGGADVRRERYAFGW